MQFLYVQTEIFKYLVYLRYIASLQYVLCSHSCRAQWSWRKDFQKHFRCFCWFLFSFHPSTSYDYTQLISLSKVLPLSSLILQLLWLTSVLNSEKNMLVHCFSGQIIDRRISLWTHHLRFLTDWGSTLLILVFSRQYYAIPVICFEILFLSQLDVQVRSLLFQDARL